jgi:hypothetical protein
MAYRSQLGINDEIREWDGNAYWVKQTLWLPEVPSLELTRLSFSIVRYPPIADG